MDDTDASTGQQPLREFTYTDPCGDVAAKMSRCGVLHAAAQQYGYRVEVEVDSTYTKGGLLTVTFRLYRTWGTKAQAAEAEAFVRGAYWMG
jgi:hypothetical protein